MDAHDRSHAAADASRPPMSGPDTPPPRPPRVDGRRLRSERTKQLIIEAYLALAQENSPQVPTAAEIAHRAGYSVRSVFERFPDIRTLQVAATDYALVQVAALAPARDSHGDRATRIKTQVETRGQSCERWLPLWRSLVANQGDSPELKQRIILSRERVVARLEFMYAPELSTLPDTERRHVLIVLEVPDRRRKLGADAGILRAVLRGGLPCLAAGHRSAAAADPGHLIVTCGNFWHLVAVTAKICSATFTICIVGFRCRTVRFRTSACR